MAGHGAWGLNNPEFLPHKNLDEAVMDQVILLFNLHRAWILPVLLSGSLYLLALQVKALMAKDSTEEGFNRHNAGR